MSQNGKGSKRRPKSVDEKTWDNNWNNIFGHNKTKKNKNVKRNKSSDNI